jgi:nucleotide-binding universal stress UspA family protein
MKTILVLIGGGDRDDVIFRTALAAAVPLSAHLDFLHVHVSAGIAAKYDSHVQFAMGAGIQDSLDHLETKAKTFSEVAADHVRKFCAASNIEICHTPAHRKNVTASFREENDTTIERLIFHARKSDLIVMGRAKQKQGLSPDTLEHLVRKCGRPVILAAAAAPQILTGTVMVCWKKSDNVTRTVAAAMPILNNAKHVVFTNIAKGDEGNTKAMHGLARQFIHKGISTDAQVIPVNKAGISGLLSAAAEDCRADLVVIGAYGHSRFRELIFGSCTEALIRDVDRPILLMH